MRKSLTIYFILFVCILSFGQKKPKITKNIDNNIYTNSLNDSLKHNKERSFDFDKKATYKDYVLINYKNDSTYLDSTLNIYKDYKFNFIRKDDFELLPFHNQGQVANNLSINLDENYIYPDIGANAKHLNYYTNKDINHYKVATPTTELAWRTGLKQGQFLDALITVNLKKNKNVFFAYKGLRSLGKYRYSLSSHGNFRTGYSYTSTNKKYELKTHLIAQDLTNQESGGLTTESITNFETNNPDFTERGRLTTNLQNAENVLRGNLYYLEHYYSLNKKDSINNKTNIIKIGHRFNYETKHYEFYHDSNSDFLGNSFHNKTIDKSELKKLTNQFSAKFKSKYILGNIKTFIEHTNIKYGFNNTAQINNQTIPQNIHEKSTNIGVNWNASLNKLKLNAFITNNIIGDIKTSLYTVNAKYQKDSLFLVKGKFISQNRTPNYNYQLYQSNYIHYNWNNNFNNIKKQTIKFDLESKKWANISIDYSNIDNYTFFGRDINDNIKALQLNKSVQILKLKVNKELRYKKFALNNTIMYQNVNQHNFNAINLPELITRNTLYYSNYVFKKKPMYLQTGITFKYFTKYYANEYNPLLAEFITQNNTEIGNFPIIDIFANARIRQTRIYIKAEHINTLFSNQKNYYSAPTYPYRDFTLRVGLVWNFFL